MALTPEEQAELGSLQAASAPPRGVTAPGGLSKDEQEEMNALHHQLNPDESALAGIGRMMNIPGGTVRAGVYNGIHPRGMDQLKADLKTALAGRYPPSSQLYGLSGPVGFAADVAQDPTPLLMKGLTALGARAAAPVANAASNALRMGAEDAMALPTSIDPAAPVRDAASKTAKFLDQNQGGTYSPVSAALRKTGKMIYQNALRPLDDAVTTAPAPSEVLWDLRKGVRGSNAGDRLDKIADGLLGQGDEIASKFSNKGGKVQPAQHLGIAEDAMNQLSKSDVDLPAVDQYRPIVDSTRLKKNLPIDDALYIKSRFRNAGKEAYGEGGSGSNARAQLNQAMARSYSDAIESGVRKLKDPNAADAADLLHDINSKAGSLIEAKKGAGALKGPPLISAGELGTGIAGYALGYPQLTKLLLAAKKAGQLGTSVGAKTYGGLGLNALGKYPVEPALNYLGAQAASPWTLLPEGNNK